ncbi:MAG: AAA family ATPase, partial [Chloroflexota bacterium]|nr:AAA family ATPase [Chloroflexota bacterium]
MLITRIELENIKSYRRLQADFRRGTTAISGANGAGKTTIVEAIGFALFDFIPYSQTQFVREGEKHGKVVVHLIGSDDRPYIVERRCGSGAYWHLYDSEADLRVEQQADVQGKLHELFGIDQERSLKALFRDALGVPQGSFTSIFLETASKRKPTFDALLQIEDYAKAPQALLETQNVYKEQMRTQQSEMQRLTIETRELETWQTTLLEARQLLHHQTEVMTRNTSQTRLAEERATLLLQQQQQLTQATQKYQQAQERLTSTQKRFHDSERELQLARTANEAVERNRAAYERYIATDVILKRLRQDERKRAILLQDHATHAQTLATIQATINHLQEQLQRVASAREKIIALSPLVEEQIGLEQQRDDLKAKDKRYQ